MRRLLLFLAIAFPAAAEAPSAIAIHNARIVPVSGPVLMQGTVVLRNGLIEAVGANAKVPPDAWVIEGDGLTVYPGLIDALSGIGIPEPVPAAAAVGTNRPNPGTTTLQLLTQSSNPPAKGPEDRPNTTSWVRAADLVRTSDSRIEAVRNYGFTTSATFPTQGIFAGQGAIIDLSGEKPGQMIVAEPVGQYLTLTNSGFGGGFPASLMGVISYIRQIYLDASYYQAARQFYTAHPRGMQRPEYDRALEGVLASPRVLLPAIRRVDIDRMIHFAQELKVKAVLYGVPEGYRSADLLKKSNTPVLISLRWPEKAPDSDPDNFDTLQVLEVHEKAPSTPAVLAKSGVKFALYSGGITRRTEWTRAVKRALDAGLSTDDALRAMTLTPAEIYGVADRLGSIEPGKIANLVVTRGDIFQDKSQVLYTIVDGVKFEPVPEPAPAQGAPGRPTATPAPEGDEE